MAKPRAGSFTQSSLLSMVFSRVHHAVDSIIPVGGRAVTSNSCSRWAALGAGSVMEPHWLATEEYRTERRNVMAMTTTTVYPVSGYPTVYLIEGGDRVTIRPMVPGDGDALLDFFRRIPEEDRFYLKEDVTSPAVIRRWAEGLDYSRALPLLALAGNSVIADGTLHRRRAGARRHIGEIRIVVEPEYRHQGVATALMRELITIAKDSDLDVLTFEVVADEQAPAIATAEALGFVRLAVLPNHVRDIHGKPHDLVVLELLLGKWEQWWNV